jgi:DNA-binding beta-propeller fold protein YncE
MITRKSVKGPVPGFLKEAFSFGKALISVLTRTTKLGLVATFISLASCSDKGEIVEPPAEIQDGVLYDVAGMVGQGGDYGDGGPALEALLYWPIDMTPLENGELLVMDWNNHRIRKITPDGIIHHFIGSGQLGDVRVGDATTARFNHPTEVKVGPDGNYWISCYHNWCIKHVDATTLTFIQVLGDTVDGYRGDYPENGGSIDFTDAPRFNLPSSLEFDPAGNLYFSDQGNTRIRKIDLNARVISSFVGGTRGDQDGVGSQAQFSLPGSQTTGTGDRGGSLDLDPSGENLYMVDTENHKIRIINIATQMVSTIAGTGDPGLEGDGGPALSALLNYPQDLVCTDTGDLFIADSHNHVVRKIDVNGIITTVAGTGVPGSSPNGTHAREANLNQPTGVAFDNATNTLYIADTYNHQIKKVINP